MWETIFPTERCSRYGVCLIDSNGNGICDELEEGDWVEPNHQESYVRGENYAKERARPQASSKRCGFSFQKSARAHS